MKSKISDLQVADELYGELKEKIKFDSITGKWLIWADKRWALTEETAVISMCADLILQKLNNNSKQENMPNNCIYQRLTSQQKIKNSLELIKPKLTTNLKQLNTNDNLFNCANGTVNLNEGILLPHNKDDLITKISGVEFQKDAECILWLEFLKKITNNNKEYIDFLQEVVGSCLSGLSNDQCLFILHGYGMNGKTVFVETIRALLGEYACNAHRSFILKETESSMDNRTEVFITSRLAILSETEEKSTLNEKFLKLLAGSDTCTFKIGKEHFEYVNKAKIFIITNAKPIVTENDDAIWRRIHLLPFEAEIPYEERNIKLIEKLKENELPGILNWAIKGFKVWREKDEGLQPPSFIKEEVKKYEQENNSISAFIEERCSTEDKNKNIQTRILYCFYKEFCEEHDLRLLSQIKFVETLKRMGYAKTRIGNERAIQGIILTKKSHNV
ncbi:MAG TPA: phage/plasmid primase, P4 family [Candidatus Gastranaerophilales bacterium]|nr:phage/plasmid primase, P4 family [Candidatus Gastranaerophilales bacterium]